MPRSSGMTMSPRVAPIYNVPMADSFLEEMKRHIGFGGADVANLRSLSGVMEPVVPSVVHMFYGRLLADPLSAAIFTGGPDQIAQPQEVFEAWLRELFSSDFDHRHYQKRFSVGRAHVNSAVPQHCVLRAMEVVWQELRSAIREAAPDDVEGKLSSLHKALMLEFAIMLESYKESYSAKIREEERTVVEQRLTRSEHLAQLGQLAASLAHEIKNPLAGISGAIQVIRDGMDRDDPHQAVIREILGQIGRLDAAVKDLLVYARPIPPELGPCDLRAIVTRVLSVNRDAPTLRRVRVNVVDQDTVPPIPADARQIEQLVVNLLFNAAHASKDGGEVEVRLSSNAERVRLGIADSGCGMDEEIRRRAFEPFFTTKAKGTGLGLPICRKIVEAHQGSIDLQSEVDAGTRVVVHLPTAAGEAATGEETD